MFRYYQLIKAFAKYRLIREMEFSANFIVTVLIHLFFIGTNLAFFALIWFRVGGFGGLTPYQMLFFMGTFHLADSLYMIFAFFGVMEIPELIRKGDMDYLLTKPVPSQFLVTFRSFNWFSLTDFILGICMIVYAITKMHTPFSWYNLFFFAVMVVNGTAISYALSCLVITLAFITIAVDAVWAIFFEIGELEKYPMGIYPPPWKMIFSITLPTILVANFPAYFGLGRLSVGELLWFFAASLALIFASHRFWQYGLKKYQSASS